MGIEPRLDPKPWGGRGLERFALPLPPGAKIGEAVVAAGESAVVAAQAARPTLDELIAAAPSRLGARGQDVVGGRARFPLLIKLIDAADNLSIQVHPDDAAARPFDRFGKTEAWHVLAAAPGSLLYLGLRPGVDVARLAAACRRGNGAAALLRAVPARAGTSVLIPAGTVHALGAGVIVYEVQQPSDLTFRLDDWGRVDADGRPRELHLDHGLAVTRPELRPELIAPVSLRSPVGRRQLLTACRFFALERIALAAGASTPVGAAASPVVLTQIWGEAEVRSGTAAVALTPGRSAVVWPVSEPSSLTAVTPAVTLRSWVPDLQAEVVAPARAAGASDHALAALGGPLADLWAARHR